MAVFYILFMNRFMSGNECFLIRKSERTLALAAFLDLLFSYSFTILKVHHAAGCVRLLSVLENIGNLI